MTSIGNDIVDLLHVNPERSQDQKFYKKFITASEIALYHQLPADAITLLQYVWLLWSVKESVYKLIRRYQPDLVFSPAKLVITQVHPPADAIPTKAPALLEPKGFTGLASWEALITFGAVSYHSRSVINRRFIATVALTDNDFNQVYWGAKVTDRHEPELQSADVRDFLFDRMKAVIGDGSYEVRKAEGDCPFLFRDSKEMNWMISLSHHGGVVGYAGNSRVTF